MPRPRRPGDTSRRQAPDRRTTQAPAPVALGTLATRPPAPYHGIAFDSDTAEIIAGNARQRSLTDVRQPAHAVNEGQSVTIEYVAASGNHTVRTVGELELDAPYLYAWCHLRDDERVFALSCLHGVMPA